jgi:hypothetical protein
MRKSIAGLAALLTLTIAGSVSAAPNNLRTQIGGDGEVTITGAKSADFDISGDANGTDYALVYVIGQSPEGRLLRQVDLGFTAEQGGEVQGGAPRLSIPIDKDGDGVTEVFVSIDTNACGGGASPLAEDVWVSTENPDCLVYFNDSSEGPYANWDALVDARPTYRVGDRKSFIIADWGPTDVTVTGIDLS